MRFPFVSTTILCALGLGACAKEAPPPQAQAEIQPQVQPEVAPALEAQPATTSPAEAGDGGAAAGETAGAGGCRYKASLPTVTGPCPAGRADQGQCELTVNGDKFTFVFKTGRACRPQSMCTFEGTVAAGTLKGNNAATVDGEGGKVTNGFVLTTDASGSGKGPATSTYSHPGGMSCTWSYELSIVQ